MKHGRIERLRKRIKTAGIILRFACCLVIVCVVFINSETFAEEIPVPFWTAADMLLEDSVTGLLRYGTRKKRY